MLKHPVCITPSAVEYFRSVFWLKLVTYVNYNLHVNYCQYINKMSVYLPNYNGEWLAIGQDWSQKSGLGFGQPPYFLLSLYLV